MCHTTSLKTLSKIFIDDKNFRIKYVKDIQKKNIIMDMPKNVNVSRNTTNYT